jgi:hypothetical protein
MYQLDEIENLLAQLLCTKPDDPRTTKLKELREKMRPRSIRVTTTSHKYDGSFHQQ